MATAEPSAMSVPPSSVTHRRSFRQPDCPTPYAQRQDSSCRSGLNPWMIRVRLVPDGSTMTSYFSERSPSKSRDEITA